MQQNDCRLCDEQALTLLADKVAAIPPMPKHGLVTSMTAMNGLDGRHLALVSNPIILGVNNHLKNPNDNVHRDVPDLALPDRLCQENASVAFLQK